MPDAIINYLKIFNKNENLKWLGKLMKLFNRLNHTCIIC